MHGRPSMVKVGYEYDHAKTRRVRRGAKNGLNKKHLPLLFLVKPPLFRKEELDVKRHGWTVVEVMYKDADRIEERRDAAARGTTLRAAGRGSEAA